MACEGQTLRCEGHRKGRSSSENGLRDSTGPEPNYHDTGCHPCYPQVSPRQAAYCDCRHVPPPTAALRLAESKQVLLIASLLTFLLSWLQKPTRRRVQGMGHASSEKLVLPKSSTPSTKRNARGQALGLMQKPTECPLCSSTLTRGEVQEAAGRQSKPSAPTTAEASPIACNCQCMQRASGTRCLSLQNRGICATNPPEVQALVGRIRGAVAAHSIAACQPAHGQNTANQGCQNVRRTRREDPGERLNGRRSKRCTQMEGCWRDSAGALSPCLDGTHATQQSPHRLGARQRGTPLNPRNEQHP